MESSSYLLTTALVTVPLIILLFIAIAVMLRLFATQSALLALPFF